MKFLNHSLVKFRRDLESEDILRMLHLSTLNLYICHLPELNTHRYEKKKNLEK